MIEKNTKFITAIRLSEEPFLYEGNTRPLKLECVVNDDFEHPKTYVIKFGSNVSGGIMGLGSEIIAGHLAKYFDIPIPNFSNVLISRELVDSIKSNPVSDPNVVSVLENNIGLLNFGSQMVTNTKLLLNDEKLTTKQLDSALMIFAFDGLIYNMDRSFRVPNMFINDDKLMIYDHEKAFCFILADPVELPKKLDFLDTNGNTYLKSHNLFSQLSKKDLNIDNFINKLEKLNDTIIDEIIDEVPEKIIINHSSRIKDIKNHLIYARNNADDFKINLLRVLA